MVLEGGLPAGAETPVTLVDDDDLYRETLAAKLGDHGFKVSAGDDTTHSRSGA
jgi:ActR/RegA family two-component response regulator